MLILLRCMLRVLASHPSRIGCKHVWCSSRWVVSTILRQEWDNLFHKSSWRLKEGLGDYSASFIYLFNRKQILTLLVWPCSRNPPFIIKVSLPHRLLEIRHSGLIKRGQSARTKNKMLMKSFYEAVARHEQVIPSVYLLRKPWEWKRKQAAGKMSRKAWMVVVESHRYRIRSISSYDR